MNADGVFKDVPATPSWSSLPPALSTSSFAPLPASKLAVLRARGQTLLDELPTRPRASSSSDAAFISQILQSGTHQDKLSALVLLVRESPIHAVKELGRLRAMAGWKEDGMGGGGNKDQRIAVSKALADWWVSGGGKVKGKLRYVFLLMPLANAVSYELSAILPINLSSPFPTSPTDIFWSLLSKII